MCIFFGTYSENSKVVMKKASEKDSVDWLEEEMKMMGLEEAAIWRKRAEEKANKKI